MYRSILHTIVALIFGAVLSQHIVAQSGTSPVGVNFILVNFDSPPTTLSVEQAPLKYNKDFALSMQVDDSDETIYTEGFQLFEGNDTYPGLNFSDGCGNNNSFKISSSTFIFNGTGVDLHNGYPGKTTWTQLDTLIQNGWGILNHGVNSDASSDPLFIDYSIERNKSYIRRKLYNSIEGGVMVHTFVNPNGNENWTNPAFDKGYISALRQSGDFPQGNDGGDVNASYVDWTQPVKFKRISADNVNIVTYVNNLANSSVGGANYWGTIFTHSLNGDYADFTSDFISIASTYGVDGLDNILMTTDEEIQDYLIVRDVTDINYVLSGNLLLITFSGEVPDDLLFYSSSIVITSDATINNITVDGTEDYTESITNNTDALINVNWDGYYVIPPEVLGDSMVTIASTLQTQYNCWVAMDYVITMTNGTHKDSLRQVLCNIPNVTYDDGFCNCLIDLQPNDTTINLDNSITLTAPSGDYDYLWEDEVDSIGNTQVISVTPSDTTKYYLTATNPYGCPALDSIIVNVRDLNINIGDDRDVCLGSSISIQGPANMVQYHWYLNNFFAGSGSSIDVMPNETTICKLAVIDQYGQTDQDSITINVLPLPDVYIQPEDSTIVLGNSIKLNGPIGNYNYQWYQEGTLISSSQNVTLLPGDTSQYKLLITDALGCSNEDSTMVNVHWYNLNFDPDTVYVCRGDSIMLEGPSDMASYHWTDGITFLGNSQIIYVKPSLTKQFFLSVTDSLGASDSDNIFVVVRLLPTVSIQSNDTLIKIGECDSIYGPANFSYYDWYEDGSTPFASTQNIEVCPSDTAQYFLIASDEHGCKGIDSITVSIDFLILDLGDDTTICEDKCVDIVGLPNMIAYEWYKDGVFFSSNQSIEACPIVSSDYSLRVVDQYANSDSDTVHINVLPKPIINLGPADSTILLGDTISLFGAQGNNSWEWYKGTNFYSYNQNIIDWPPDTIQYKHIASGGNGCVAKDSIMINVHSLVISLIQDTVFICDGDSTTLVGPSGMAVYTWDDGNSIIGNVQNVTVNPNVSTKYFINVTDTIGASANDSIVVVVRSLPNIIIQSNDTTIDYGNCTQLSGPSGFYNYSWYIGDTLISTTQNTIVCPEDTTQYNLVASNIYGCYGSDSVTININYLILDLGPDTTICLDNCVYLEGPPNMVTYVWYEDGVVISSSQSIEPCPIDTTQYSLLVIDQNNISARDTIQINVLPKPIVNLGSPDTTIILGESIELFGAQDAIMWEWYKGTILFSNNPNILDWPTDTIQYKEIATNIYGCTAEDSIMVNVHSFTFDLGPNDTICPGICDSIIGPPDMAFYEWWIGDSILPDTTQSIYKCPLDTTTYTLVVEDTIGAQATDSITYFILPSPTVVLQPKDSTINNGLCIDLFGPDSSDYTYQWYMEDSLLVDTTYMINQCPTADSTLYTLIVTNSYGCSTEDSAYVFVNQFSFDLGPDTTVCQYTCVELIGPPNMVEYRWTVADTVYATTETIEPCPGDTTTYILWVKNDNGATAEDSISINTKNNPTVSFVEDSLRACFGSNVEISVIASEDVVDFHWYYNAFDTITQTSSFVLRNVDISASVNVVVTSINECNAFKSSYLTVVPYPDIVASNDTTICPSDSITLSVSGGAIYLWIVEEDTISTEPDIKVLPSIQTDYIVQTAFADSLCFSVDTITVMLYDPVYTKISYDTNIVCTYEFIELMAEGADHYLWTPGGDTNALFSFTILDTTTMYLTGINNNGCHSIDSVTLYTKPVPSVSFTGLFSAFCENDPAVDLVGIPSGGSFTGNGIVGNRFIPAAAGSGVHEVYYSLTNAENCTGRDTVITTVYSSGGSINLGDDFTLQLNESKLLDAGAGFNNYYWTTGETTQTITVVGTAKPTGTYEYAVMGVIHGCSTRGSVNITFVNPDGYDEVHLPNLSIYPNPNLGKFTIKFSSVEKDISINITNIQGNDVYRDQKVSCDKDCKVEIDLVGVNSGFYFLQIATPTGLSTAKIIIK